MEVVGWREGEFSGRATRECVMGLRKGWWHKRGVYFAIASGRGFFGRTFARGEKAVI